MQIPLVSQRLVVPDDWIDINDHMNATHYGLVIYNAHVRFTDAIGMGEEYVRRHRCGKAVIESHMIYEREVGRGEELEVHSWLLSVDERKLHFFHELYNLTRGERAATAEQLDIHVDLIRRRACPLPDAVLRRLQALVAATRQLPLPDKVGRTLRPPENGWLTGNGSAL